MGTQLPHDYPPPDLDTRPPWTLLLLDSVRENLFAIGIIGIVFILGVLLVYQFGVFGDTKQQQELRELELMAERARHAREEPATPPPRHVVSIFSEPDGALIYLNSDPVGVTPLLDHPVAAGVLSMSLRKHEFSPRDTLVFIAEGRPAYYYFDLSKAEDPLIAEDTGRLPDQTERPAQMRDGRATESGSSTQPSDNRPIPQRPALPSASPRREQPEAAVSRDEPMTPLDRVLQPRGTIQIIVRPWGTIYIDGVVHVRDTDVMYTASLAPGTHHVTAVHPALGTLNTNVRVEPESTETIVLDFNQTYSVTITSAPTFGEIIVNGRPTGFYTPHRLALPAGEHRVDVRRDGYSSSGPQTIRIESDIAEPLGFELIEENS